MDLDWSFGGASRDDREFPGSAEAGRVLPVVIEKGQIMAEVEHPHAEPHAHPHARKHFRMGRVKPRVPLMALNFRNYRIKDLPDPPATVDYTAKVKSWPMYENDVLGDCVIACGGHEIGCWTANESGQEVTFTNDQITQLYTAIGGYDPTAALVPGPDGTMVNPTDKGCLIGDLMKYLMTTGYPGGHGIVGFVRVNNANQGEVQDACYLFGTVTLGISLPDSWLPGPNFANGFVWDVDTANPANGHCVPIVGYNAQGVQVVTWGLVGTITWAALKDTSIVDEAYAKVSNDWAADPTPAPNGFNKTQLLSDLNMLTASR